MMEHCYSDVWKFDNLFVINGMIIFVILDAFINIIK